MGGLSVREELCTGCRACVAVCAFWHTGRFGALGGRIRVRHVPERCESQPAVCRQCREALCQDACPAGAIGRGTGGGSPPRVDRDSCTGCGLCLEACPHGGVSLDGEGKAAICDLCGGEAWCARVCFPGALALARPEPEEDGHASA
ncbi:MAG: 4Fe-4S binding protein [Acetobacteraceae bacterium]|nr:4Fe-4S binding protein [Acetobacteraceae bacterium]